MSAIAPFVGRAPKDDSVQSDECQLEGLEAGMSCFKPLGESHGNLTRLAWMRTTLEDLLSERHVWVERSGNRHYLHIDPPIAQDEIAWQQTARATGIDKIALLDDANAKMKCPTWDLPAGALETGGTCPGATAGQSTVPQSKRETAARFIVERGDFVPARGKGRKLPVLAGQPLERAVCEYCVTGDTLVMVRGRGLVRIDSIGDEEVEVWSGRAWRKTHAVMNGVRQVVELEVSWGQRLRLTPDHEVITADRGRVRADQLQRGDRLVYELPSVLPWADHAPIRRRSDAVADGTRRYRTAVAETFPSEWTFDVGLLLGYILGDGTVSRGRYPTVSVCASATDRSDLERLRDIVAGWCSTNTEIRDFTPAPNEFSADPKPMSALHWRVLGLADFLTDLGLDKTVEPRLRRAPAGLFESTEAAVVGFLSGLFSTDGSVCYRQGKKVEVTLASVSEPLLRDVQSLLFACGIRATICRYATASAERLEVGYNELWKLNISSIEHVRRFAAKIGFFNQRKATALAAALADLADMKPLRRLPVVERVSECCVLEPVYDLVNVGDEHQFVANGVSISNCYASENNYLYPENQGGEVLRYWWTETLLKEGAAGVEEWVSTMVAALEVFSYSGEAMTDPRTGRKVRPVRIHSAGDFYSQRYAAAWIEIINRMPDNVFWAPTRTWAGGPSWLKFWRENLSKVKHGNFALRPSGYYFNNAAPSPEFVPWPDGRWIDGMAMGTCSVLGHEVEPADRRFDWQCRTYVPDAEGSCKNAERPTPDGKPSGQLGCRACWLMPHLRIMYTAH